MTAAQPIGDYRLDLYRSTPFQNETTFELPPCFAMAPALSDPEDPFPTARERADMPNDKDDPREAATLIPETDREPERKTQPPGEADAQAQRVMETMLPGAPSTAANPWATPPEWWEGSFFQDLFNRMERSAERIAEAEEGSARRERMAQEQHNAVVEILLRTESSTRASWDGMRQQLETWQRASVARDNAQDAKLESHDGKFERIERQMADLKQEVLDALPVAMRDILTPYIERIEALENEIAELKAHAPRTPSPAATG